MDNPTPEKIKIKRAEAGLTQTQCAAIVYSDLRTWQRWEAGQWKMNQAIWEFFLIKTGQLK